MGTAMLLWLAKVYLVLNETVHVATVITKVAMSVLGVEKASQGQRGQKGLPRTLKHHFSCALKSEMLCPAWLRVWHLLGRHLWDG